MRRRDGALEGQELEMTIPERLAELGKTYTQRNQLYGNNYHRHGPLMAELFPEGVQLITANDQARFGILTMMISKLSRYAANFRWGGHEDSLNDLAVYSQMLVELDAIGRSQAAEKEK
jgi:4-hydroxy-L-threonine phosphate dehydrogenase PdxA